MGSEMLALIVIFIPVFDAGIRVQFLKGRPFLWPISNRGSLSLRSDPMRSLDIPNPSRRELVAGLAVLTILAAITMTRLDRPQQSMASELPGIPSPSESPGIAAADQQASPAKGEKSATTSE
jgi:hypothetical protein